jgi:hypothetical protein
VENKTAGMFFGKSAENLVSKTNPEKTNLPDQLKRTLAA